MARPRAEKARARSTIWRRVLVALAAVAVFAGSFVATLAYHFVSGVTSEGPGGKVADAQVVHADEPFNILVLGVDLPQKPGAPTRSDTMILVSVDQLTGTVSLISIPRDSFVEIPREAVEPGERVPRGRTKITHAHAFGGPDLSVATVSALLDVPVHRYVEVDVEAFRRIVDLLGGVDICVEKPMHYEDPYQDLYIHLEPGCQHLDGAKALQYVRYRSDSDINRIERQQKFIKAMVEQALSLGLVSRLPAITAELTRRVRTDLSAGEMAQLATLAARYAVPFDPSRLRMATLPGTDAHYDEAGWVWVLDEQAKEEIVERMVWRIEPERNALVRVAVEDAGGGPQAAARIAERLRAAGYQVVEVRAGEPVPASRIVSRRADEVMEGLAWRALRVALPGIRVERRLDPEAGEDLTVLVGPDAAGVEADDESGGE